MSLTRRQWLGSLTTGVALSAGGRRDRVLPDVRTAEMRSRQVRRPDGSVDWPAVRALFPLSPDWIHLASFLLVSHPAPVAEAIERFRRKIDADPLWIEAAAFSDREGRPFASVKQALADYVGGAPDEICLTPNTTTGLAMVYHGLRIRRDQEILTTEHEHYSHHESIRLAAERAGCGVRYVRQYDRAAEADATAVVERTARAIRPATRAVGVTWVHSSTGVKLPLAAIADAVRRANRGRADADRCLLIVDGVHGFGNQDLDIARLGCDFFAAGTHKWLFAPRGTGFVWGRREAWLELRPTIPTFDPDAPQPWEAWMARTTMPPTRASFVSPGGFLAYEYLLAVPAAVELHRGIGRDRIAARVAELNAAVREGLASIRGITLHTPRAPGLSGGISCFDVAGVTADEVAHRLEARRIRTSSSPYRPSYARVGAGIMNSPEEIDTVLGEIRALAPRSGGRVTRER
jgi:selenocysteine lyase/cysteine desulfurase